MGESLIYLTDRFPFHPGEHFLEAEIRHLSDHFERISLIPLAESVDETSDPRPVPVNVEVVSAVRETAWLKWRTTGFLGRLASGLVSPSWWFGDLFRMRPVQPRMLFGELAQVKLLTECIESIIDVDEHAAVASFWLNRPAAVAANLGCRHRRLVTFSRGHGGDIYPHRQGMRHLPLQRATLARLDGVLCDSRKGAEHVRLQHRGFADKVDVGRLGVENQTTVCPASEDGIMRLLSLSSMVPVKRVHLIAQALLLVGRKVVWTHVGDGECRQEVEAVVNELGGDVKVELVGEMSHDDVLERLGEGPFDVLLNVSESEGLPVSIMEAFSFGIPAIATDAGGSAEIVDDECGHVIAIDHPPEVLASLLQDFELGESSKRTAARNKQRSEYHDAANQAAFADLMLRAARDKR